MFSNITYVQHVEYCTVFNKRYDLTVMGYKFLEIEINVGPSSYVEITLGDNHEQELSLSLET